jgi:hypothetical protein
MLFTGIFYVLNKFTSEWLFHELWKISSRRVFVA